MHHSLNYLSKLYKIRSAILKFSLLFLPLIFLVGCSTTQQAQHAQAVRSCEQQCHQRLKQCQQICDENCLACEIEAKQSAKKSYAQYQRERCIEGKTFILRLQSYHDPLQCRKMSCDCHADHRVCVESCRGKIHKRIQVEKTCC